MKNMKNNKTLNEIKEKITEKKNFLMETYGVEEIGIFGSFARGEDTLLSDIDLLFDINENKEDVVSIFDLVDMKLYLENLLGKTVDIVEKGSIKPGFKNQILNDVIMI